jgi:hypothetical protein
VLSRPPLHALPYNGIHRRKAVMPAMAIGRWR